MKRLLLLRHAKAVPGREGERDHERALAPRGERDAAWAGAAILAGQWAPTLALVSDARRTRETFDHAARVLPVPPRLQLVPPLYDAPVAQILAVIADVSDEVESLLVIGHNPGIGEAAARLARSGAEAERARLADGYPTAALTVLTLRGPHWRDVGAGGTLDALLLPP